MKTPISLLALGAFALLPFNAPQQAKAEGYYDRDYRLERDIHRDRDAIRHDFAERRYYAIREHEAARHGRFWEALRFSWRKHHEDREIAERRADLHRDYRHLDRY